jgi:NADPH:quinone reductase-like Zn-dependent oxidoreductase
LRPRVPCSAPSSVPKQRVRVLLARERDADYEHLSRLIEDNRVVPNLDCTYPLEQAPAAMPRLENGDVRGKVAITV